MAVAVAHGLAMRTGSQPVWGKSTLGDFAVDGFFVLSGFLVTRSYLKLSSLIRFAWHRFLRIMPGFWVCLVVTALVIAPLAAFLQGYPLTMPFTTDPTAFDYLLGNVTLWITEYNLAGVFADNPTPLIVNGSLWTLLFEAFCYMLVGAVGVTGLLRFRPVVIPVTAAVMWLLSIAQEAGVNVFLGDDLIRMVFVFFLGSSAHLYAHRIPMSAWLAVPAIAVFLVSVATLHNYRLVGAVPFAYAILWFSACFRWPVSLRTDLSYGVYIYHWPVLQLMAVTGLVNISVPLFVLIGLVITGAAAALSWFLVEKPALARKHNAVPDRIEGKVGEAWHTVRAGARVG